MDIIKLVALKRKLKRDSELAYAKHVREKEDNQMNIKKNAKVKISNRKNQEKMNRWRALQRIKRKRGENNDAWESLTETNLKRAWRKIWPYNKGKDNQEEDGDIDGAVKEITDICSKLSGFEECDKDDAMVWLAVDSNDPGYQILTDKEIADILPNEEDEDIETMGSDGDDTENETEETGPTHFEAFVAAETLMSWLEKQKESSPTQ
ncbi:hypothetical protein RN001_007300 [Aquatica leii]|uniref:Uncharacterized protein n=1 Tax=Aquatica leii TaxID=1421715 RepID=A0AAN7PW71_9COLE|nr:hypothetical protein RN001_007300 [Aquatica leii]